MVLRLSPIAFLLVFGFATNIRAQYYFNQQQQSNYLPQGRPIKIVIHNDDGNDNYGQRRPVVNNRRIVIEEVEKVTEKNYVDPTYDPDNDFDDGFGNNFNRNNFVRNRINNEQSRPDANPIRRQITGNGNFGEVIAGGPDCSTTSGYPGVCYPYGHCYYLYGDLRSMSREICSTTIDNGRQITGVCCPLDLDFTPNQQEDIPYRLNVPPRPRQQLQINRAQIEQATRQADQDVVRFFRMEELFVGPLGQVQIAFTPAHFLQMMFGPADQNQLLNNLWGFRALQVTRALGDRFGLTPEQMRDGLSQISLHGTRYQQYCIRPPRCDARLKYRTIDGSCNNIRHPLWGKSLTQYNRLLPPEYADGINELRLSVNGRPLPLSRKVSTEVFETSGGNDARSSERWNVMFMQWGQFLDHDITLGSSTRASTGQGLLCCNRTNAQGPLIHPACRPILLPRDDPFYSRYNRQCNNFVRNAVGPKNDCTLGPREQTNTVTSFIDGSMVYGNDFNRSRLVRSFEDGLLNTETINGREWLPFDTMNNSLACSIQQSVGQNSQRAQPRRGRVRSRCVFAGDVRVNQQFGLIALQLLFLREHNRLARLLKRMNPRWDDELLYEEARRIVSGQIQHITYNEFLPEALGRNVLRRYELTLQPTGHCLGYDQSINPSILNEFASAAYRWHTLVQKYYHMSDANGRDLQRYEMNRIFNNPTLVYAQNGLDQAINGVLKHQSERFDRIFTEDIKNLLFANGNNTARVGMDLMAINIQRGRDHGMPTYNQVRQLCGLPPVRDFRQMSQISANRDDGQRLARTYNHVDDIDFWVGGNLERPLNEGLLGPTFSCVVGEQFRRLKFGDRFWYENGEMPHSFNDRQLAQLRKVTLAGIICENSDGINRIQPLAMLTISQQNQVIDCSSIPKMDLSAWQESNQAAPRTNRQNGRQLNGGANRRRQQPPRARFSQARRRPNAQNRPRNAYEYFNEAGLFE